MINGIKWYNGWYFQRYATTAVTASLFHQIADAAGITIQVSLP